MSRLDVFNVATPRTARVSSRKQLGLLVLILLLASVRVLATSYWKGQLFGPKSPLLYQASTLGFNYFEMGAIRRGLGGTLVYLLGSDQLHATVLFHLLSALAVALAACMNLARLKAPLATRVVFAFVLVAMMMRWAEDAGRTDMAVASLLALAGLAMTRRRLVIATACICVGLFIHETSFIFGIPLLVAMVSRHGESKFPRRTMAAAVALLVATLLSYAGIVWLPHADRHAMAEIVRSKLLSDQIVDWGIYFALSGARGVQTSVCQNRTDPNFWLHTVGGLVVIVVMMLALARGSRAMWTFAAIAAVPPFLFLCFVANDTSRWTMLASFNAWLVLVTFDTDGELRPSGFTRMAPIAAIAFLLLTHPKPDKIEYPIYAGSPLLEYVARRLKGPRTPSIEEVLQRCDPRWRDVLDDPTPEPRGSAPAGLP